MHHNCPEELMDIIDDLPRFDRALMNLATRLDLNLVQLNADHIALRCHQVTTAERWKRGLSQMGELFSENMINGRPVCLFSLQQPLTVGPWSIDVIELPWPGERHYRHEGWEHVEIVLRGEPDTLGKRAMALFSDHALQQKGIVFKSRTPKGENKGLPNLTLAVSDGEITLKFHCWTLKEIVASERD